MDDRNPKQIYCFKPFPTTSVTSADKKGYWNIINSREASKLNGGAQCVLSVVPWWIKRTND